MSGIAALDINEHRGGQHSECPPSPAPSVSLLEIKEDTRLVLRAFLCHTASVPIAQRPGRVGGAYRDPHKFSASAKVDHKRAEDGRDALGEQTSSEDDKKHTFKYLIKKRLKSRPSTSQRLQKDSLKTDGELRADVVSPYSSTSEEGSGGEEEKKKKKKKKLKSPFSTLIRKIKLSKKESSNKDNTHPKRPISLAIGDRRTDPVETVSSPGHSPKFYEGVAETLDKIVQKHSVKRRECSSETSDKEALVQQLVQALQVQGDAIDNKIQSDLFLRSSLTRLSYPSFANLVDRFTSQTEILCPAPASPTLSRIAMTMEVSRRVITATGTQRIQGFAERYMESFTPWVKTQGGWENIFRSEDVLEYD
ncbi:hypothetical protein AAFF_G00366450 [Aldrovandia affinis]|uniref:Bcl-2-like protein 12 n=1 Tax=Aldrovandia affinis TaxID=143900 RepID=A0AAD7SI06_9TELE|nr:hypothetical protein AAFF_G00366450 [Aldrovandia affinis]